MNGANPCRNWHNPRVVKRVLLHLLTPTCYHGKPNRTAVYPQFWGQFCLMLLLDFRSVPNGLKKWSIQPNRFLRWIGSQLNLLWSFTWRKTCTFWLGSLQLFAKNRPATWRHFNVGLVCQTTVHHHHAGGFWDDETRRIPPGHVHLDRPGDSKIESAGSEKAAGSESKSGPG